MDSDIIEVNSLQEENQSQEFLENNQVHCTPLDNEVGLNRDFDPMPQYGQVAEYQNELETPVSVEAALHFGTAYGKQAIGLKGTYKSAASCVEKKWLSSFKDNRRFKWQNLTIKDVLGTGSFGTVCSAQIGNQTVALKQFRPKALASEIWKERDMLIHLKNQRVINILGAFFDLGSYLVLEHCYGSLAHMYNVITPRQTLRFTFHLLEGLKYIHSKRIVHCDLRPDNCLITKRNTLVISDFGNAQVLPTGKDFVRGKTRMLSHPGFSDYNSCVGKFYSYSSDLFGAGCCIFLMDKARHLCLYDFGLLRKMNPSTEYGRVARQGRLIKGPGQSMLDFSGKRVPLWKIVESSQYSPVLKEMVKDTYHRKSAAALLKDPLLMRLQKEHQITDNQINFDSESGQLFEKLDVTRSFHLQENTLASALSLKMIYYDEDDFNTDTYVSTRPMINETHAEVRRVPAPFTSSEPKQFLAVPLEMIKSELSKVLLASAINVTRVVETNGHHVFDLGPPSNNKKSEASGKRKAISLQADQEFCSPAVSLQINNSDYKTAQDQPVSKKTRKDQGLSTKKDAVKGALAWKEKKKQQETKVFTKTKQDETFLRDPQRTETILKPSKTKAQEASDRSLAFSDNNKTLETPLHRSAKRSSDLASTKLIASKQNCPLQASTVQMFPKTTKTKTTLYKCIKECSFTSKDKANVREHKQQCLIWWKMKGEPRLKQLEKEEGTKMEMK